MRKSRFWIQNWEKLTAFGCGMVFIAVLLVIALLIPQPTMTQWFVFRVVLALAAAGIGAVIPGLIVVSVSNFVRAGGAIALFVLVYWVNPPQLIVTEAPSVGVQQTTSGKGSPAVISSGDVNIGAQPSEKRELRKK